MTCTWDACRTHVGKHRSWASHCMKCICATCCRWHAYAVLCMCMLQCCTCACFDAHACVFQCICSAMDQMYADPEQESSHETDRPQHALQRLSQIRVRDTQHTQHTQHAHVHTRACTCTKRAHIHASSTSASTCAYNTQSVQTMCCMCIFLSLSPPLVVPSPRSSPPPSSSHTPLQNRTIACHNPQHPPMHAHCTQHHMPRYSVNVRMRVNDSRRESGSACLG